MELSEGIGSFNVKPAVTQILVWYEAVACGANFLEQVLLKIGRCIRSQNDLDFKMAAKSCTLAAQPHKASVTTPTVCYPAQQVKLHCNQCSSVSPRFVWRLFGERESSDTCCKTSGLVEYPALVVAGWAVHL